MLKLFLINIQESIKDYLLLYLETDVLHLIDVFKEFRNTCFNHYKLDPLCFYTSPRVSVECNA